MTKKFRVQLLGSVIGCTQSQRDAIRCLGLRRRHHQVVVADNPAMRGQIMKVQHLVSVSIEEQAK